VFLNTGSRGIFDKCFSNTSALPCINIGADYTDVWGESNIMTGVYQRWCSSTLHIGWGLCDLLCLVLVYRGRYCFLGVFLLFILESNSGGGGPVRGLRGEEEGGGVRSGPGAARTILLFHTISARPSKQPRMVGSTLGVFSFGLIFVSARTNKRHHHQGERKRERALGLPLCHSPRH
jgi:hypothetical protein